MTVILFTTILIKEASVSKLNLFITKPHEHYQAQYMVPLKQNYLMDLELSQ